jgi:hypothetical protein
VRCNPKQYNPKSNVGACAKNVLMEESAPDTGQTGPLCQWLPSADV